MAPLTADLVVVAAGASRRMAGVDKLAAPIAGRPLLAWSAGAFAASDAIDRIVVVATADQVEALRAATWLPARATVVTGGARRQESVAAGIAELERRGSLSDGVVLIHDGARPNVTDALIRNVIDAAAEHGAAIPVVPVIETLKQVEDGRVVGTVERAGLGAAQTPQGVRLGLLRTAYERFAPTSAPTFTDEAGLLEACTIPVHVVPGTPDNIKVTVPADLERASAVLAPERARVGYGDDFHPFGPGSPLALGGIDHPGAPRLSGHSDGDVVLHAVAGALLGAAGLGDLGRMFPADARTPRGVPSAELVAEVVARVAAGGHRPATVDVTIVGARPRLGDRLDAIRDRLAELLGLERVFVNVKASTGNLAGFEGAGRGISARAIATIERAR